MSLCVRCLCWLLTALESLVAGSGEGHTAYFYKRTIPLVRAPAGEPKVALKKRAGIAGETDQEVSCDAAFAEAVALAAGPVAAVRAKAEALVAEHLSSNRPKRDRRPRRLSY